MAPTNVSRKRPPPRNLYLTPLSYNLILKFIKIGSLFRMHPYVWDDLTGRVEQTSDKKRLRVWYVNVLITIANCIFVTIRAVQVFQDDKTSPRDKILGAFGVAYYMFPPNFHMTYFLGGDEFPGLINQSLALLKDLNRKVPPTDLGQKQQKYPIEVRIAEFHACNLYYGFQVLGVLVLIFGFELPEANFLISSLVDDPRSLWMPYRLLFLTYLAYISCFNYVIAAWLVMMAVGTLTFPLCAALKALSERRLTPETIHIYRCIQLWVAKFNRIYGPLMLPFAEILLIALSTLGIVGVIRYPGVIGMAVGSIGLTAYTLLYLIFGFFGTMNERSRRVTEGWRVEAGSAARQLRALRPISVTIGSYCFIDRCLILTATNIVVNNSITLLLVE